MALLHSVRRFNCWRLFSPLVVFDLHFGLNWDIFVKHVSSESNFHVSHRAS